MKASEAVAEIVASRQQLAEVGGDISRLYDKIAALEEAASGNADLPAELVAQIQGIKADAAALNERTPNPGDTPDPVDPIEPDAGADSGSTGGDPDGSGTVARRRT